VEIFIKEEGKEKGRRI